jgi:hypothetical protein
MGNVPLLDLDFMEYGPAPEYDFCGQRGPVHGRSRKAGIQDGADSKPLRVFYTLGVF